MEVDTAPNEAPNREEYVIEFVSMPSEHRPQIVLQATADVNNVIVPTPSTSSKVGQPSPPKKRGVQENEPEDESSMCPICFDHWTTSGTHRLSALKCGHCFGLRCLERWFSQAKKTCPTCQTKAHQKDIRFIYARKLIASDTTDLEMTRSQLQNVTEARNRLKVELDQYVSRNRLLMLELEQLKTQIKCHRQYMPMTGKKITFVRDSTVEVCKNGCGRYFDVNSCRDLLVTSAKSPLPSGMGGYGVKILSLANQKTLAFYPVHNKEIKDLSFHRFNNQFLTASQDYTCKIFDLSSKQSAAKFEIDKEPMWSCCWDVNNPRTVYAGTQLGAVVQFDTRNHQEPLCRLTIEGDCSPVISLTSIGGVPGGVLPLGGLIICKLRSLWVYEITPTELKRHAIALVGPFTSMEYDEKSQQLLVTARPANHPQRHYICSLIKDENGVQCNVIHTIQGGSIHQYMTKSCFMGSVHFAAFHQDLRSVCLWSVSSGQRVLSIPIHDKSLSLKGFQSEAGELLISSSGDKLEFFKLHYVAAEL